MASRQACITGTWAKFTEPRQSHVLCEDSDNQILLLAHNGVGFITLRKWTY
jgi:hypothetical protein